MLLALIGQMYFVLDVCHVVVAQSYPNEKDNQDTLPILLKYVGYIAVLSSLIVVLQHFS
jgi:hypothetical protein